MKVLTLRVKLILGYALLFFILISIFSFIFYSITSTILLQNEKNIILEENEHAISHLISKLESDNDSYYYDLQDLITAKTKIAIFINNENISSHEIEPEIIKLPKKYYSHRVSQIDGHIWLIYDHPGYSEGKEVFWVRLARPLDVIYNTLGNIRILIYISIPSFIIISTLISIFLVSKSLAPINNLIKITRNFGKQNLSERLKIFNTSDEVGILTRTFNEMLERLEAAFERESEFATSASHELRTPLSVILAQTEEALSENKSIEDYKKALNLILRKSKSINYLVSQLLTLSRDYDKKFILNKEIINLDTLLDDVVDDMKNKAKTKGIKIFFEKKQKIKIKADQTLIATLLLNIIDNSIKYNKKDGFIKINLNRKNEFVEISVEDSGIGISKEELSKIFTRFYRVDKKIANKSFGLGLSIVKWIVDSHQGKLNIISEVGKGTMFIILLPIGL